MHLAIAFCERMPIRPSLHGDQTMDFPTLDLTMAMLLATILIAGVARGLSGFGTGMIVAPVAGALYGPKAALVVIVIIDSLPAIPVTIPALRIARWGEVLPVTLGLLVLFPAGIWLLTNGDEHTLRWLICAAILTCVLALWSGWRYSGPRNAATSFGVGGVAGVLSGIAAIPGPPVIAYWIAGGFPAAIVRANLLTLFLLGEFVSIGNLWIAGLFEREVVMRGLLATPFYFAGILIGWAMFARSGEHLYRLVTFGLIVLAALLALPVFDSAFEALAGLFEA
jgi:uncharacterized membrane protein YfcA